MHHATAAGKDAMEAADANTEAVKLLNAPGNAETADVASTVGEKNSNDKRQHPSKTDNGWTTD